MANSSPEAILDRLTASNIFDLRGVVAVVTGGGTVRSEFFIFKATITIETNSTLYNEDME